jgi:hypothetical protein
MVGLSSEGYIELPVMQVTTVINQHITQLIELHRLQAVFLDLAPCMRLRNMESNTGAVVAATYWGEC